MDYLVAAANIRAFNYGLKGSTDPALFKKVLSKVIVPEFKPKSGVQVQVKDDEPVEKKEDEEETLADVAASLPAPSTLAGYRMLPAEFEKDDDTNHHIDVSLHYSLYPEGASSSRTSTVKARTDARGALSPSSSRPHPISGPSTTPSRPRIVTRRSSSQARLFRRSPRPHRWRLAWSVWNFTKSVSPGKFHFESS